MHTPPCDIEDRIGALLRSDPLPPDAEAQLARLVAQLPADHPEHTVGMYHEALLVARDHARAAAVGSLRLNPD